MKTMLILCVLVFTGITTLGQQTIFFGKNGHIYKEYMYIPNKDTLKIIHQDLTSFPGTAKEQLEALQNPGKKITVSVQDSFEISIFKGSYQKYKKNQDIFSPDGKILQISDDNKYYLASESSIIWFIIIFCSITIILSFLTGQHIVKLKCTVNKFYLMLLGIIIGSGIIFSILILFNNDVPNILKYITIGGLLLIFVLIGKTLYLFIFENFFWFLGIIIGLLIVGPISSTMFELSSGFKLIIATYFIINISVASGYCWQKHEIHKKIYSLWTKKQLS